MIPTIISMLESIALSFLSEATVAKLKAQALGALKSKYALPIVGVVALVIISQVQYARGYAAAERKQHAAGTLSELNTVKHDLAIQKDVAATASKERDRLAAQATKLQDKVRKYETGLSASRACALNGSDVRRLRSIQ